MLDVLKFFPNEIFDAINTYFMNETEKIKTVEEIRLRADRPIQIKFNKVERMLNKPVTQESIIKTIQCVCDNSIYSYQKQICEGFITVKGGHRIGVSGSAVLENSKITNINYISSLNFRIAREVKGCSNKLLKYVLDLENNNIFTTLIVSPPGVRKNYHIKRFNKKYKFGSRRN